MPAKQVIYSGHVQGVGFRYTVKRIASGYEVTGWVKNLPNGNVQVLAISETEAELEAFLLAISESALGGNIKDSVAEDITETSEVKGFSIVH